MDIGTKRNSPTKKGWNVNNYEFTAVMKWLKELNITTVGQIADLHERYKFKDVGHFINYLNACHVFGEII